MSVGEGLTLPRPQPAQEPTGPLAICDTCVFLIANGECIECIHEQDPPDECPHNAALTRIWGPGEITLGLIAGECDYCPDADGFECEPSFSMSDCDGCGSGLGGNRLHATGWVAAQ